MWFTLFSPRLTFADILNRISHKKNLKSSIPFHSHFTCFQVFLIIDHYKYSNSSEQVPTINWDNDLTICCYQALITIIWSVQRNVATLFLKTQRAIWRIRTGNYSWRKLNNSGNKNSDKTTFPGRNTIRFNQQKITRETFLWSWKQECWGSCFVSQANDPFVPGAGP